ncbi:hypothetical protein [Roseobacter sp.]|uniref:hypothetical protein n=1 Tax=Roseobacter sp. TaxID=1907202 RepID=UPI00296648BB|nr:hypothetical protein [Roseobacter sp.]MDW3181784.1 hypothetical protein [Roseobacter sp.]
MANFVSLAAGLFLFFVSILVMTAYRPNWRAWGSADFLLGFAIFLGFMSDGMNTLWWQILGSANYHFEVVPGPVYRHVGLWLDGLLKGSAGLAGILHLVAIKKNLPPSEQPHWYWWEMAWYPQRRRCVSLFRKTITRKDEP